jgi:hypothetical protein
MNYSLQSHITIGLFFGDKHVTLLFQKYNHFYMTKQASFSTQMRLMIKYFFDKRTNLLSCILDWLIFLTNVLASCAALFQQNFMIYL